ncbi:MAG TPA: endonuclease/exonuclease/phosphatase family protein [Stellaceae bacterium]|nr:endonuclease/exonuclease/phosphatase family protein [Stellaceae bacterium]
MPTIASYNIHSCIGRDGVMAPQRIVAVIRELDADVVALQEVEAQHRQGALDQWVFLARELGYFCTPGISLRTQRRNYGNALLSRWPAEMVRLHDLSVDRREPRGAIDIDFRVEVGRSLRVISTHLGLRRAERRLQIAAIRKILAAKSDDDAALLLGDLNEWRPGSANLRALRPLFHPSPAPPTFPANRPLFALDRILAAGTVRVRDIAAHRSDLARIASDHLPIRATVWWEGV